MGFRDPKDSNEPEAAEDRFTLIRCDECNKLTARGVMPILANTASLARRTTTEQWLCVKCLRQAGIPIKVGKKDLFGPIVLIQRAYDWVRERLGG